MRVILLSGGVDSACLAAWVKPEVSLFVDYGQRAASGEGRASRRIAQTLALPWASVTADCRAVGAGSMAGGTDVRAAPTTEWWPFRNQLLGTIAAAWAVREGIDASVWPSGEGR